MSQFQAPVEETANRTRQLVAVAIAAALFGVWGLAQWLYNQQFQQFAIFFAFTPNQLAWTLSLFNIAYCVLAIPAALFHRHFGYKLGLLLSLSLFGVGAFLLYFAIIQNAPGFFLSAIVTLGSGWAWFETCLNPMTVEAGRPQTAIYRLNMVQVFNALGLLGGCYVAQKLAAAHYYLSEGSVAQSAAHPYVVVGLVSLLIAFAIEKVKLPASADSHNKDAAGILPELRTLASDKGVVLAAAALAAYCLTLTVIWSATYNYRVQELASREFPIVADVFFWFVVGRCIGAPLMRWIDPVRLLMVSAGFSLAAVAIAYAAGGITGWYCLLAISAFMSIAFPTVFAATIVRHGTQTKLVSGVLVAVAGFGSAIGPLFVTPALADWPVRTVLLLAAPFVAVVLGWTVFAARSYRTA
jgi:FHS family L-fucose permease-like MFS transporter